MRDNIAGIFILCTISSIVIITSATALHPFGIRVNSAAEMAIQLESLFGIYSKYVFSLGLSAAAFSSLLVNSVISGCLLSDSLGLGKTLDAKYPKIFTVLTLIIGMVVAVFFKGDIIYALIMAQASSILGVPLIAVGIFLIANNKKVMGNYVNGKIQNVLAVFGFVLISVMVYFIYVKLIHFVGQVL